MKNYKAFILLSLSIAWICWGINLFLDLGTTSLEGKLSIAIGGLSPAMAALFLIYRFASREERSDYFRRLTNWRLISWMQFTRIPIYPFTILMLAIAFSKLIGNPEIGFQIQRDVPLEIFSFASFAIAVFFFGPMPEELGWRGYLLDALGSRFNVLQSSLVIALVWGLWHVPLFFIEGYPLQEKWADPLAMVVFFALLFPISIVFSWFYYQTNRSILAAVLLHFFINFFGMIWETDGKTDLIVFIIWSLVAWVVVTRQPLFFYKARVS